LLDDFNADCIAYLVHCVNHFAWVTDALREALAQLDYENEETRETSRWPERVMCKNGILEAEAKCLLAR